MSKADKMFEKLGYEKEDETTEYVKYTKNIYEDVFQDIIFDLVHNLVNVVREDRAFYRTITAILSIEELQAINKKVEELGWNIY